MVLMLPVWAPTLPMRGTPAAHIPSARTHPHTQVWGRQGNEAQLFAQELEEPGSVNTGGEPEQAGGTQPPTAEALWFRWD